MTGKLAQLAALQQIGQSGQAQQTQANDSRMRAAMGMLGLLQQGQQDEAQNVFRAQQLEQQKAAEANRQGEYWGGTLPLQYTEQAGLEAHRKAQEEQANRAFADESGYRWGVQAPGVWDEEAKRKEALAQQAKVNSETIQQRMQGDILQSLLTDPTMAEEYRRRIDPTYAAAAQGRHQTEVTQQIPAQTVPVSAVYQKNQHDPARLQQALAMLQSTMHPDVWNGLPWDQLNQSLPTPIAPTPARPSAQPQPARSSEVDEKGRPMAPLDYRKWNWLPPM